MCSEPGRHGVDCRRREDGVGKSAEGEVAEGFVGTRKGGRGQVVQCPAAEANIRCPGLWGQVVKSVRVSLGSLHSSRPKAIRPRRTRQQNERLRRPSRVSCAFRASLLLCYFILRPFRVCSRTRVCGRIPGSAAKYGDEGRFLNGTREPNGKRIECRTSMDRGCDRRSRRGRRRKKVTKGRGGDVVPCRSGRRWRSLEGDRSSNSWRSGGSVRCRRSSRRILGGSCKGSSSFAL